MMTKMKIILGIFGVVVCLYVIHFTITYIKKEKRKENFFDGDDEVEQFESSDKNYKDVLAILKEVDRCCDEQNCSKHTKSELTKEMFSEMSVANSNSEELKTKVNTVLKRLIHSKAETFESPSSGPGTSSPPTIGASPGASSPGTSSPPTIGASPGASSPGTSSPPTIGASPGASGPGTSSPPITSGSTDMMQIKKQSYDTLKSHVDTLQSLVNNLRTNDTPSSTMPSIRESFVVEGFEDNPRYAKL
jgi:hypothetical protein